MNKRIVSSRQWAMRAHLWLSLILISSAGLAFGQLDALKDALPLTKDAIFLLPAEQASASHIEESSWSSDGKYLLIRRRVSDLSTREFERILDGSDTSQTPVRHQIVVYSALTGKTKVLTDIPESIDIEGMSWIPGTSSAVVDTREVVGSVANRAMSIVSATGGLVGTLDPNLVGSMPIRGGSPALPYLWTLQGSLQHVGSTEVRFVGEKGLLPHVALVPDLGGFIIYRNQGRDLYYIKSDNGKRLPGGWRIFPETGKVEHVDQIPPFSTNQEPEPDVLMQYAQAKYTGGKTAQTASIVKLVAKNGTDTVTVTTDGERAELAPNYTAVCYESRGSLMVRRIVHVPLDYYKNKLLVALRVRALVAAKQLGLSLILYAADNDKLPDHSNHWKEDIGPYLKNDDLANSFNYTFTGSKLPTDQSVATTELGYVDGPDGRAIVYADGHAKYIGP